jgi:BirA family transcriptional regulator, biotin operon repressor / biotin---[acetyl-CoA-carboxylase] ligase
MATPYLQLRREEVPSTQDLARAELDRLPVVVISERQTEGRGRTGSTWMTAPRALAVSVAFRIAAGDGRPLSLMAGIAAVRAMSGTLLKWPNDLVVDNLKIGGILVERSDAVVVAGIGVNLWWPDSPEGIGALSEVDPGPTAHAEIGALWAAELIDLLDGDGWPRDEYREACVTLGRQITWEPEGAGVAVDISSAGELIVEMEGDRHVLGSGAIRHVRG